ncbi:MAG: hypothetical protein LC808_29260, partial [Actinobacteria bacterium]|nr:hypothetical protein [Actinomycetota bacterium]
MERATAFEDTAGWLVCHAAVSVVASSGRREFHPPALADPGVNLSAHRAPVIRLLPSLFSFAVPI